MQKNFHITVMWKKNNDILFKLYYIISICCTINSINVSRQHLLSLIYEINKTPPIKVIRITIENNRKYKKTLK